MKNIFVLLISLATISTGLFAQQDAQYSLYNWNGLFVNPAYAGSKEVVSVMGIYRNQWTDIEGSPKSLNFSIHTPLGKSMRNNLGLVIANDRLGLTDMTTATLNYAYRIPVGNGSTRLALGLNGGVTYFDHSLRDANIFENNASNDPQFQENHYLWLPNFGAGAYLHGDKYFIGVSVPHLFNNSLNEAFHNATDNNFTARQYKHYFATAGYVFSLGDDVKFKPSVLMKYVTDAPVDFDITAAFLFFDRVWLAAQHRLGDSYDFMGVFKLTPQFGIGYAYDLTVSDLSSVAGGSHEIMVNYDFWFDQGKIVNPRYIKYF